MPTAKPYSARTLDLKKSYLERVNQGEMLLVGSSLGGNFNCETSHRKFSGSEFLQDVSYNTGYRLTLYTD